MISKARGIGKVVVLLTDSHDNTRRTQTNPFSYYSFGSVASGETYIITANSKRYQFAQPTQVLPVTEELNDVDFTVSTFSVAR